jgi:hypothetical protein
MLLDLFPALMEYGAELIVRDDNRLCYEASLLTLLNYGVPPNLVSIEEIEAALAGRDKIKQNVSNLLQQSVGRDCLRQANLRLRTFCKPAASTTSRKLDDHAIKEVWRGVAEFFDRPITRDEMGRWSSWVDAAHIWPRGVLQDYLAVEPITVDFIKELIDSGHVALPAWMLYFHIQAHGLYGVEKRATLRTILDPDKTTEFSGLAARRMTEKLLLEKDAWRLRSFIPLLLVKLVSENRWSEIVGRLSNPESMLFADATAILLLRTRHDREPDGNALVDIVNVSKILEYWRMNREPKEEVRTPVDDGYRFLQKIAADRAKSRGRSVST